MDLVFRQRRKDADLTDELALTCGWQFKITSMRARNPAGRTRRATRVGGLAGRCNTIRQCKSYASTNEVR
jgi:hypothetical protein